MLRTTIGLSFILVLGGFAACSSKATDDDDNVGGNGAIVGGTGNAGGTTGNGAGTPNTSTGGKTSSGGATSTGGIATGACSDETITCVDATHAKACNFETGMVDTFNCVEEFAALGFTASGCTPDPTGDFCDITGVADAACQAGAQVFARCEGATTEEQLFNIYVNCFQDFMDAHTVIPCFSDFGTAGTITANQCLMAEETCFPGAGGAGPGDMGAGGAP